MPIKTKRPINVKLKAKASEILAYAHEMVSTCRYSNELFNAIFSPKGKAAKVFPDHADRAAFFRTKEYREIRKLEERLPRPPVEYVGDLVPNGHLTVALRMPKTLHAALIEEADAEGVGLEQLCRSKLVAQLRKLV
jgi:hypothetical protein